MERLKETIYAESAKNLRNDFDEGGFESVGKRVLEAANIKPIYTLEERDPEAFHANREKLASEAGLVIANHPGYFDSFLIFNALKRKDVKLIVSESNYELFAPVIGEDLLIKAAKDASEAFSFLKSIKDHIESGGLVLLYPSGGADRADKDNDNPEFQNGFSIVLKRCLKPDNMVYSFRIEPEDIKAVIDEKIPRMPGVVSAVAIDPSFNINRLKDEASIRVDERYSKAEEWLGILKTAEKEERNSTLTRHFIEGFDNK